MYITSINKALEIWMQGFVTGIGISFIAIITYVCYKSFEKQELKKKRELKKQQEEKDKKKRRKKK